MLSLVRRAEQNCSDENIDALVNEGRQYVYKSEAKEFAKDIYQRIFALAERMYIEKRFSQGYTLFSVSLYFLDKRDWPSWIMTFKSAAQIALMFDIDSSEKALMKLVKLLKEASNLKAIAKIPFAQSKEFLDELFGLAGYFSTLKTDARHYKSTAIVLLKLVVEIEPADYYRKNAVTSLLSNLKKTTLQETIQSERAFSIELPADNKKRKLDQIISEESRIEGASLRA